MARRKSELSLNVKRRMGQVIAQLHAQHETILKTIECFRSPLKWNAPFGGIKGLLETDYPNIYSYLQISKHSLDDFVIVGHDNKNMKDDYLFNCWKNGETFPEWLRHHMIGTMDYLFDRFWTYPHDERLGMIERWQEEVLLPEQEDLRQCINEFNQLLEEKLSIQREKDSQILKDARVIGATTTGAAQYRDILSSKSAGVVIVEEAGEVLESHVLASLSEETEYTKATKHLILIGDHKQLRPKVEDYKLTTVSANGYNLDCSLFERLVTSNLPCVSLNVQHRMRPKIADIIRLQTYKSLEDHASVTSFPDVKGVSKNIVFIDHEVQEDGASNEDEYGNTKTKSNTFEAELCVEMVRYFLLQGYKPCQMVVLTPYVGQILKLVSFMKKNIKETSAYINELDQKELEDLSDGLNPTEYSNVTEAQSVRCSSVDNFQGEEADIIIISLVRSNKRGNIGFLKEEQRVNVLLSRARYGMFIVGSKSTLLQSNKGGPVWSPVLNLMQQRNQLMKGLPTTCQLHPDDDDIVLSRPDDFRRLRPNGGCSRPCSYRMECGHVCPMACHPIDQSHKIAQRECCEPCTRFPPECIHNHMCPKLCREKCGPFDFCS